MSGILIVDAQDPRQTSKLWSVYAFPCEKIVHVQRMPSQNSQAFCLMGVGDTVYNIAASFETVIKAMETIQQTYQTVSIRTLEKNDG